MDEACLPLFEAEAHRVPVDRPVPIRSELVAHGVLRGAPERSSDLLAVQLF